MTEKESTEKEICNFYQQTYKKNSAEEKIHIILDHQNLWKIKKGTTISIGDKESFNSIKII